VHATAVAARAEDAMELYPGADVTADLGPFQNGFPNITPPRSASLPGAGRGGGYGTPDLVVTPGASGATSSQVWEVKYGSAYGQYLAPIQLARYLTAANSLNFYNSPATAGIEFPESHTLLSPSGNYTVVVNSTAPGVELYNIVEGTKKIYEVCLQKLHQRNITPQAEASGQLTETHTANSVTIQMNGSMIFTYTTLDGGQVLLGGDLAIF